MSNSDRNYEGIEEPTLTRDPKFSCSYGNLLSSGEAQINESDEFVSTEPEYKQTSNTAESAESAESVEGNGKGLSDVRHTTVDDITVESAQRSDAAKETTFAADKETASVAKNAAATALATPFAAAMSSSVPIESAQLSPVSLPHTYSEPLISEQQRRNKQQQKIKNYRHVKQVAVWGSDATAPTSVATASVNVGDTNLSLVPKFSDTTGLLPRRVSFPKSDNHLVTGYLEPANPWENGYTVQSVSEIAESYVISCYKHCTKPLQIILDHLKTLELNTQQRQPLLCLKSVKLTPSDCEALEEVFRRVQYKSIDLSSCDLDESAANALFEMIEYYEASHEVDISLNSRGMTHRGWWSCNYMIGHSQALQVLNAQGNPISKSTSDSLGRALTTSNLQTLKLEHCGLKGPPLSGLCFHLRNNRIMKELWIAHNDLDCNDADAIADLLKHNHYLELVDISNNNIKDEGIQHIVRALILQSRELERRSMLQRSAAIDDDSGISPSEISPVAERNPNRVNETQSTTKNVAASKCKGNPMEKTTEEIMERAPDSKGEIVTKDTAGAKSTTPTFLTVDENDVDEDTEETIISSSVKSSSQSAGQSMLDKLLSMNSDSSSDDATSNISTDTIAAGCLADFSNVSDEVSNMVTPPASSTCTNTKAMYCREPDITSTTLAPNAVFERATTEATNIEGDSKIGDNIDSPTPLSSNKPHGDESELNVHQQDTIEGDRLAIFEVTPIESDCLISDVSAESVSETHSLVLQNPSPALDVNNSTRVTEDYDELHSADSAFESASEGDISRHIPEEFAKVHNIETGTIATESTECLVNAAATTILLTPPFETQSMQTINEANICESVELPPTPMTVAVVETITKGTVVVSTAEARSDETCTHAAGSISVEAKDANNAHSPTPPLRSTSPGTTSFGIRRTESSCSFITSSTRNRSQSTDSLCSDNSLDGSTSSDFNYPSSQLNEKLTKNDTLTRQQRQLEPPVEASARAPAGLKALAVWNNNLTKDSGFYISDLLSETVSLELLNIGKNCLSNEFVFRMKDSLMKNTTLTTLGLQSAHLSAKGIAMLSSVLTFGGNSTLQRIDIRDNKLEVESLTTIAEVLKSNTTLTQIDIDDEPKRLSLEIVPIVPCVNIVPPTPISQEIVGSDEHLDYARVLENVRSMCSRNEKTQAQLQMEKSANSGAAAKRRGGYYVGSRKISLTCHSRPLIDTAALSVGITPVAKLEVKRKTGARLRSPVPSPPSGSPSSSPNRSRFQVFRVSEVSPLSSPLAHTSTQHVACTSSEPALVSNTTQFAGVNNQCRLTSTSLPTSSSLPSMATVTSSTQPVKRLCISARSRFHVSKVYEDPRLPLSKQSLPPITPPLYPPPTPMAKNASQATLAPQAESADCISSSVSAHSPIKFMDQDRVSDNTNNSSTSSKLTCLTSLSMSSSSSSSTSPASTSGSPSSSVPGSSLTCSEQHRNSLPSVKQCPIAVFNDSDNDITLMKSPTTGKMSNALAAAAAASTITDTETGDMEDPPTAESAQQRVRKTSWIGNPAAVDRLLTLFNNPGAIFQRGTPEPEATAVANSTLPNNFAESTIGRCTLQQQTQQENSLVSMCKVSPPSWSKIGTEILNASGTEITNTAMSSAASAAEQSRSFLDVASKQLRDFGKQVFRQNLSYGNEQSSAGTTINEDIAVSTGTNGDHDATLIPTDVKQEIKENISPEHTINEETLHDLKKLCVGMGTFSGTSEETGTKLSPDNSTVTEHKELKDDMAGIEFEESSAHST